MTRAFATLVMALLTACVGYQPDQRVVGSFEAPSGEVVVIRQDGRIFYVSGGKEEFLGLVTIDKEEPLSIRVIAPDTSRLVGTEITFSSNRRQITVEWPSWQRMIGAVARSSSFIAR